MRYAAAATAGAISAWAIITLTANPQIEYHTQVVERIRVNEVLTTIDLDDLRHEIDDLDEQLYTECVEVIHRKTGDPKAGIINLVERHYEGNACRAADEALNGLW